MFDFEQRKTERKPRLIYKRLRRSIFCNSVQSVIVCTQNEPNCHAVTPCLFCAVSFSLSQERKIVGCYFTNWSQYRGGVAKFQPHNINTTLCTHVHYLYARVNTTASGLQSIEPNEPGW